jgi:outer membrane immunogenic protein
MRKLLAVTLLAGAATLSPAAFAQDSDWTGFYVGGSAGYSFKADDEALVFDTDLDGQFDDTVLTSIGSDNFAQGFCNGAAMGSTPAAGCRASDGNIKLSVRAGFDLQLGNWVVGVLGDYSALKLGDDVTGFSSSPVASYTFTRDLNSLSSARLRGGWSTDMSLLYATAGWAWGDMDHSFTTTNTVNSFVVSEDSEVDGLQLGLGFEQKLEPLWLLGSDWTMGVEYLWTSLDDGDYPVRVGPGTATATNPFITANPLGTDIERTKDVFEYSTIGITLNWRP